MFKYNQPNITGISICCNPAPVAFHAHTSDDNLSFYQSTPSASVWIYMPLEQNERIVNIWMRHRYRLDRDPALAFETDKGQVKLFGAQPTPSLSVCRWGLLDAPGGSPGHFFFDDHPYGIRRIYSDFPRLKETRKLSLPVASSPYPASPNSDSFIWTRAPVENVVAVRPCRRQIKGETWIIGLMFYYADGKHAPVGEVRLDHLDGPITIHGRQPLYLGFTSAERKGPFISRIETTDEQSDSNVRMWFEIAFGSTPLEWWLSARQCQVYQSGRRSLAVRY